jgi:hypothetical protein
VGTDAVRLFDKRLCDLILAVKEAGLADFVEVQLQNFSEFSIFRYGFAPGTTGPERVAELALQGLPSEVLKQELVQELCFLDERMAVDYWGCFAEVFSWGAPPGAISDTALFPHREQELFLLLQPEHVTRMLDSLRAHQGELTIMAEPELARLQSWRETCLKDRGRMVAYLFGS